jgi:hypothetical protein
MNRVKELFARPDITLTVLDIYTIPSRVGRTVIVKHTFWLHLGDMTEPCYKYISTRAMHTRPNRPYSEPLSQHSCDPHTVYSGALCNPRHLVFRRILAILRLDYSIYGHLYRRLTTNWTSLVSG